MRALSELSEREVLALAIASEEEDARVYRAFAEKCRAEFPASAAIFDEMAEEERGHRDSLYGLFSRRFGEHLPPIRREDVRGFMKRRQIWWEDNAGPERFRAEAAVMEEQAANFYDTAAGQTTDLEVRKLLTHLAEIERGHERKVDQLSEAHLTGEAVAGESEARKRRFVLTYVQPGLAGLIDGSVSTLAPLFAAAFATKSNHETFLVGLAASVGAGISMGITEAMSDDGKISGRGSPWVRGWVCGLMTTIGGLGHTLPYLIPNSWANAFWWATAIAGVVVAIELVLIAWIRTHYMETPFMRSIIQVIVGGALVLAAGVWIGSS